MEGTGFGQDPLSKVDFNLLIPLQVLLVETSVTRAAERTGVTQPAMSGSLARLRRHFGDPLLTRDGRGMKLTPFGAALVEPVNHAVDAMRSALGGRRTTKPRPAGRTFTVAAGDYVSIILVKPLLQALRASAPDVSLKIIPPGEDVLSPLDHDACDLLIAPRSSAPQGTVNYHSRHLCTDKFVAVADDATLGDSGRPAGEVSEAGAVTAGSFVARMCLVADTPMTTIVPARLYELLGRKFGLRAIPLETEIPLYETMYWHPRHNADPEHIWLRDELSDVARSLR